MPSTVLVTTLKPAWVVSAALWALSAARWQLLAMSEAVAAISSLAVATVAVWPATDSAPTEIEVEVEVRLLDSAASDLEATAICEMIPPMFSMNRFSFSARSPISSWRFPTPSARSATLSQSMPSGLSSALTKRTMTAIPAARKIAPRTNRACVCLVTGAKTSSLLAVTQRYQSAAGILE